MTVKEYIVSKFGGFGITFSDADFADISTSVDLNDPFSEENRIVVFTQLAKFIIPQLLLRAKSVSENGFTISWDNDALMKYYAWLCELTGVENRLGSFIDDISDNW